MFLFFFLSIIRKSPSFYRGRNTLDFPISSALTKAAIRGCVEELTLPLAWQVIAPKFSRLIESAPLVLQAEKFILRRKSRVFSGLPDFRFFFALDSRPKRVYYGVGSPVFPRREPSKVTQPAEKDEFYDIVDAPYSWTHYHECAVCHKEFCHSTGQSTPISRRCYFFRSGEPPVCNCCTDIAITKAIEDSERQAINGQQ